MPAPLPAPILGVCQLCASVTPPPEDTLGSHQQGPGLGDATLALKEAEGFNLGIGQCSSRKEAVMGTVTGMVTVTEQGSHAQLGVGPGAWCGVWCEVWCGTWHRIQGMLWLGT